MPDDAKLCPLKAGAAMQAEIEYGTGMMAGGMDRYRTCDGERCRWWLNGPAEAGGQSCTATALGSVVDVLMEIRNRMVAHV